jgi:hypothetical protein
MRIASVLFLGALLLGCGGAPPAPLDDPAGDKADSPRRAANELEVGAYPATGQFTREVRRLEYRFEGKAGWPINFVAFAETFPPRLEVISPSGARAVYFGWYRDFPGGGTWYAFSDPQDSTEKTPLAESGMYQLIVTPEESAEPAPPRTGTVRLYIDGDIPCTPGSRFLECPSYMFCADYTETPICVHDRHSR